MESSPWSKSSAKLAELFLSHEISEEDCASFCHVFAREFYHQVADVLMERLRESLKVEIMADVSIMCQSMKPPTASDILAGFTTDTSIDASTSTDELRQSQTSILADPNDADDEMPRKKTPEELLADNPLFKMITASRSDRLAIATDRFEEKIASNGAHPTAEELNQYARDTWTDISENSSDSDSDSEDAWNAAMREKYNC